ncbi:histidine phosphatase family protein [Sabulilitoribacter multivorans]|uniref:Histidine phosphatase family protein n=1 Tax=Flaviramulus multivorans TaxID=1304750 RepID=A0ABS9IHC4_9FLAO|nr:phosphoglycerate mutase family protein [Flaviramulus multivorans]MCF7560161.1 histidine phosphatase family protein [Flaviramulus multivorans]
MKLINLFALVCILSITSCKQEQNRIPSEEKITSTYYFIRHAEKDRSDSLNNDPHLTEKGLERAKKWSEVLKNVSFDAVYSTDYNRTRETALPTATNNNLDLILYNPRTIEIDSFINTTKGKNVLVVGHSNTTPGFVNTILKTNTYEDIDDANNANLYIVTIINNQITSSLLFID